ncbi:la-related protein 6B-like [Zingiber officinale]|uniref:la-related protein 6B-like n=1 Tax=Zingiber officinale TaxID=94328 RepID=UPI001C4A87D9|nr:la-related protein 6B-like [Zingiber officinale]XP_042451886.1 la-related protein 6B-like [Zingiber officinale]
MAEEILEQTLGTHEARAMSSVPGGGDDRSPMEAGDSSLWRSLSASRLNAQAAEFVPRSTQLPAPSSVPIRHGHATAAHPVKHVFHQAPPNPTYFIPSSSSLEYYGPAQPGGFKDHEGGHTSADPERTPQERDGIPEEVIQKITKQVEYYFSDANLATTEHLMRFISKDPDGFVPISVVAAFKKIKSLVSNNSQLAMALRTSSKLVVSDDGKRVRRQQLFTESDLEMLQSRIVVAENLPEDHCYQNLMKIFSSVGCVKTIRTCYPPSANGTAPANNKSTRLEMLFGNRLHAFVEYESIEDAEKAVAELNDEKNWRNGLRVKLFHKFLMKHGATRGRRGQEGDFNGEEDVSTSNQSNEKLVGDAYHSSDVSHDHENDENFNEKDGALRRGRGRGRGGRRGRGQHQNNNRGGGHLVGTPPSSHSIHSDREQLVANKQPPGPRMPDGTRGFTLGRGKPVISTSTV